jgi:hypothetical protein
VQRGERGEAVRAVERVGGGTVLAERLGLANRRGACRLTKGLEPIAAVAHALTVAAVDNITADGCPYAAEEDARQRVDKALPVALRDVACF